MHSNVTFHACWTASCSNFHKSDSTQVYFEIYVLKYNLKTNGNRFFMQFRMDGNEFFGPLSTSVETFAFCIFVSSALLWKLNAHAIVCFLLYLKIQSEKVQGFVSKILLRYLSKKIAFENFLTVYSDKRTLRSKI